MRTQGDATQLDQSGRDGNSGGQAQPHYPMSTDPGTGRDGADGGHAFGNTPGQDAGQIVIYPRQPVLHQGSFEISGRILPPEGRLERNMSPLQVEIGTDGTLLLDAHGGTGGGDAHGGSPQRGGDGRDGSDAYATHMGNGFWKETPAGNGTDGGDAGAIGLAQSGADGGRAGRIVINIPSDRTHLVALFPHNVSGGVGGRAGRDGEVRRGGRGGSGGSSYSGSATYQDGYDEQQVTRTKPDGTTYTETIRTPRMRTTTVFVPGGSDGRDGRSSRIPRRSSPLVDGQTQPDGEFVINVIGPDGQIESSHDSAFDLEIYDYEAIDMDGTGFFEPGRRGEIRKIKVRNRGGMPTPELPVYVLLADSQYVLADPVRVTVPRLNAGQEMTIEGPFPFTVKDLDYIPRGNRFVDVGRGNVLSYITMIEETAASERAYEENGEYVDGRVSDDGHFEPLTVRYPILFSPMITLRSLVPGKTVEVVFEVRNDSNRDFGSDSDWGRDVRAFLDLDDGNELDPNMLEFIAPNGQSVTGNETLLIAIQSLKAKGTVDEDGRHLDRALVRAYVHLRPEAEEASFQNVQLRVRVGVSDGPGDSELTMVQERAVEDMTVTEIFTPDDDNTQQWLLIVNNETTDEEIRLWRRKAIMAGKDLTIWDLSLYGHIDLAEKLRQGHTIMEHFKDGLMIVLNNDFDPGVGSIRADELALQEIMVQARTQFNMGVLLVSTSEDGARKAVERVTFPITVASENEALNNFDDYFEAVQSRGEHTKLLEEASERVESENLMLAPLSTMFETYGDDVVQVFAKSYDTINIGGSTFFGVPKEDVVRSQALNGLVKLGHLDPEFTYFAVYNYDPHRVDSGFSNFDLFGRTGIRKDWEIGSVQIRRGPDYRSGSVVALEITEAQMRDPEYVLGEDMDRAIRLAQNAEQNIKDLRRYMNRVLYDVRERQIHENDPSLARDGYIGDNIGPLGRDRVNAEQLGISDRDIDDAIHFMGRNIVAVLLNRLAEEQNIYRNSFRKRGMSTQDIRRELQTLRSLVAGFDDFLGAGRVFENRDTPLYDNLLNLVAGLAIFEDANSNLYRWFRLTRNQTISAASQLERQSLQLSLFGTKGDDTDYGTPNWDAFVERLKRMKAESKELKKADGIKWKEAVTRLVMAPTLEQNIFTSREIRQGAEERLLSQEDLGEQEDFENEAARKRQAFRALVEEARGELQLTGEEDEFLRSLVQSVDLQIASPPDVLDPQAEVHFVTNGREACKNALSRAETGFVQEALRMWRLLIEGN